MLENIMTVCVEVNNYTPASSENAIVESGISQDAARAITGRIEEIIGDCEESASVGQEFISYFSVFSPEPLLVCVKGRADSRTTLKIYITPRESVAAAVPAALPGTSLRGATGRPGIPDAVVTNMLLSLTSLESVYSAPARTYILTDSMQVVEAVFEEYDNLTPRVYGMGECIMSFGNLTDTAPGITVCFCSEPESRENFLLQINESAGDRSIIDLTGLNCNVQRRIVYPCFAQSAVNTLYESTDDKVSLNQNVISFLNRISLDGYDKVPAAAGCAMYELTKELSPELLRGITISEKELELFRAAPKELYTSK